MTTPQDDLLDGELIASIADGTCVLFLGAGFTSAFSSVGGENVKTASELGESIVKSLIERLDGSSHVPARVIAATTSLTEDGRRTYQLRLASQFFISELVRYGNIDPEVAREDLVELLVEETGQSFSLETVTAAAPLLSLPWSSIYTTNYDSLVESTLAAIGVPYQVTSRPSDLVERAGDRLEIVKIHGSIDEVHLDRELPLVVTSDDYASFGWTRGLLLDELRVNLAQRDVLFLGYGLQDENLDTVIREVSRAISHTPRSLYVQTRGTAEEPWWNYLRLRNFKVRRSQDLVRLAGRLNEALTDFRTSHDAGYVDYAVTSRNGNDDKYDTAELMSIKTAVARETWRSSRTFASTVDLSSCGSDPVAALYFFMRAKRVESTDPGAQQMLVARKTAIREWLKSHTLHVTPTRPNWHRTLECLGLSAPELDDDHVRRVVELVRKNSQVHSDSLSKWLTLQLVRDLQMKTDPDELTALNGFVIGEARSWRAEPNSRAGSQCRPVVPRLAWILCRVGGYEDFLRPADQQTWGDLLLSWELSKVSGRPVRLSDEPEQVRRLSDGVRVDSRWIRRLTGPSAESWSSLATAPLSRRASLRAELDRARSAGPAAVVTLLEGIDLELRGSDRHSDVVEPFFASFVLLEHLSALLKDPDCDDATLSTAHRQLMIAANDAIDDLEADPDGSSVQSSRASHFATAMCRDLLYGTRTLEQRQMMSGVEADRFVHLTKRLARLSGSHQWMVENLLNVSVHLSRLPESTPLVQDVLDDIHAQVTREPVWESLSPLLRYYVAKSEQAKGRNVRG